MSAGLDKSNSLMYWTSDLLCRTSD